MDKQQIATAATNLKNNDFLPIVLDMVKADIIQQWQSASNQVDREQFWHQQKVLEYLAGAIQRECKRAIERSGDG